MRPEACLKYAQPSGYLGATSLITGIGFWIVSCFWMLQLWLAASVAVSDTV